MAEAARSGAPRSGRDDAPRLATAAATPSPDARPLENALRLLQIEAEIRHIETADALGFHLANDSRQMLGFRQLFLLRRANRRMRVRRASAVADIDPNAPLIRWVEDVAARLERSRGLHAGCAFALPAHADPESEITTGAVFREFLWVPLVASGGSVFGGILMSRDAPWPAESRTLAERLAGAYAHAFRALEGARLDRPRGWRKRSLAAVLAVAVIALMQIPVPLTVLAPAEVIGRDAPIVTAPLDGVVAEMHVVNEAPVAAGDVLLRLEDTELANALAIAEEAVALAEVAHAQQSQASFVDPAAASEIAMATARLKLARVERDVAQTRLDRVHLRAPAAGRVVIEDAPEWVGRPVRVGERILSIADPAMVAIRIDLPVADAIPLSERARVRLFLDTDPLDPLDGQLFARTFVATPAADGSTGFTLRATLDPGEQPPRLGARGTAQVFGARHPLWYVLFRRPITTLRQALGI